MLIRINTLLISFLISSLSFSQSDIAANNSSDIISIGSDSNCDEIYFNYGTIFSCIILSIESDVIVVSDCPKRAEEYRIKIESIALINGQAISEFLAGQKKQNTSVPENNESAPKVGNSKSIKLKHIRTGNINTIEEGNYIKIKTKDNQKFNGIIHAISNDSIRIVMNNGYKVWVTFKNIATIKDRNNHLFTWGVGLSIRVTAWTLITSGTVTALSYNRGGILVALIGFGIDRLGARIQRKKYTINNKWEIIMSN